MITRIKGPYRRTWTTAKGVEQEAWMVEWWDDAFAPPDDRHRKQFTKRKGPDGADAFRASLLEQKRAGFSSAGLSAGASVTEAGEHWLNVCEKVGRKRGHGACDTYTVEKYRSQFNKYIVPMLGSRRIASITPAEARRLQMSIAVEPDIPTGMRKKIFDMVKSIFAEAVGTYITANPFAGLVLAGDKGARQRAREAANKLLGVASEDGKRLPTLAEARTLLAKVAVKRAAEEELHPDRHVWRGYEAVLQTAVFSGCRISELLGLDWKHVDTKRGLIHVVQRADSKGRIGPPKNAKSVRSVNIPPHVCALIEEWRPHSPKGKLNLVFPNGAGNVESQSNLRDRFWIPLLEAAKLMVTLPDGTKVTPFGFHDWRHLRNSVMKAIAGGDVTRLTMAEHGWSSPAMPNSVYDHVLGDPEIADRRRAVVDAVTTIMMGSAAREGRTNPRATPMVGPHQSAKKRPTVGPHAAGKSLKIQARPVAS